MWGKEERGGKRLGRRRMQCRTGRQWRTFEVSPGPEIVSNHTGGAGEWRGGKEERKGGRRRRRRRERIVSEWWVWMWVCVCERERELGSSQPPPSKDCGKNKSNKIEFK